MLLCPLLPPEVWLHITSFIPTLSLRDLYAINSTFFHVAFDARYRQICFIYWDDRLLRNLIRLRDPYVARRVKVLHLHPGFFQERENVSHTTPSLRGCQDRALMSRCRKGQNSIQRLRECFRTAQDVTDAVFDVLRSLRHLTDYHIAWYDLPATPKLAVPCIGAPFCRSLTKLHLDISLANIGALCSTSFHIARLQHLHLHLRSDSQAFLVHPSHTLYTELARCISCLSSFLLSLHIEADQAIDISPLFDGILKMEKLSNLSLTFPLNRPHFGDPMSLSRFLRRQSDTIKNLRLSVRQPDPGGLGSAYNWRGVGQPDSWSLQSWVRTALGGGEHDNYDMKVLESVEVSSRHMPLETSLYCVERFGHRVNSFGLMGSYKSYGFVKSMIAILGNSQRRLITRPPRLGGIVVSTPINLCTLRLGPVSFSPELLGLLAKNLPSLEHLELVVDHFLPSLDHIPLFNTSRSGRDRGDLNGVQLVDQLYEFLEAMQDQCIWPQWGLKSIAVYTIASTLSMQVPVPLSLLSSFTSAPSSYATTQSLLSSTLLGSTASASTTTTTITTTTTTTTTTSSRRSGLSFWRKWAKLRLWRVEKGERVEVGQTSCSRSRGAGSSADVRIAFEVVLTEVLRGCLPGVKVVR